MIKIGKNISKFSTYSCKPETKYELVDIIRLRIFEDGPNCDLNDIDTSLITDMSYLFYKSPFTGSISKWNTSNVVDMTRLFKESSFNGDISNWDVSNIESMEAMFYRSKFNKDISKWNVSNVKNMIHTFMESKFNQDISNWKLNKDCLTNEMFADCSIKKEFKPKALQR